MSAFPHTSYVRTVELRPRTSAAILVVMMYARSTRHRLPPWCWWLVGLASLGDIVTSLAAWHVGLHDDNPLYANPHTATGLLLLMHVAALLAIAALTRWHAGAGRLCAVLAALLLYLPITLINTASIVLWLHLQRG